ncbi:GNAT family N-acetyltransferase [Arthrobacter sp. UKPF54-2]|uniref:GNAT family N-acetyltransferase n=1 Tax=Arthrobacter sp. UKPF54-2 TaxID=2600159 RepID=UPI0011B1B742|nr:GNAT family N-acetyltransferase [Arthrobacter sp. UKPF54-2]QDY91254.1 GNAT family N-acetyltransferase [Arthrobacter sp. UKPF54-2]
MNPLIILTAATGPREGVRPAAAIRPIRADDIPRLDAMYRDAYAHALPQPPERAVGWIDALLDGAEGRHVPEASAVLAGPDGQLAAAIIVTEPASGTAEAWDSVIAELFTHPDHRRQGLAEELLGHCLHVLHTLGRTRVAVAVDSGNSAALALYLSRDFRRLADDDGD